MDLTLLAIVPCVEKRENRKHDQPLDGMRGSSSGFL